MEEKMKKLCLSLLLCCFALTLAAAPKNWLTDLDDALQTAKKQRKPVLILITGSDWCPPCKKLYRDVLETKDFKKFARKNLVLLYVDSPRRPSPADRQLLSEVQNKYGRARGVPHTILLDSDGNMIQQFSGYRADYKNQVEKIIRKAK